MFDLLLQKDRLTVKTHISASSLLGASLLLALTAPAFAQDTDQQATAPEEEAHEDDEDENVIIVQGTRLGRRLQDEPIRVEVIAGEEIKEKAIMRPATSPCWSTRPAACACR